MEFIKAEEFLKQPVDIQKVFLEWWKPSIGDLFAWVSDEDIQDYREVQCCVSENVVKSSAKWKGIKEGERIPLLVEGQLRKFVEDKTNEKNIELNFFYDTGYDLTLVGGFAEADTTYERLGHDMLQAYWKVATEITKE